RARRRRSDLGLPAWTDTLSCRRFAQGGDGMAKRWLVRVVYLVVAALALANGGCLALAIGGAAAGGAAGYALYLRGQLYRDYHANLTDATATVKTVLGEMQLPVVSEKADGGEVQIESVTGDGDK